MNKQPERDAERVAIVARRKVVAGYLRKGITSCRFIAEQMGNVSYGTIHLDKKAILARWRKETRDRAGEAFMAQLHGIQWRRTELLAEWERSKLNAESLTEKEAKEGSEVSRTTKGQTGDPRYMAELRALDEREDALLGLTKNPDTGSTASVDAMRRTTPEELLERFRKRMAAMIPANQENGE